jgi:hypothetical protein
MMMKNALSLGLCLALLFGTGSVLAQDTVQVERGQRQLFLDDHVVQEMPGLSRSMHQPEKRGAVIKPDIPSDGDLIQIRSAPMWDAAADIYKLLYLAYARDGRNVVGVALATSKDGIRWEKPNLGAMEIFGSKANNWIPMAPELTWPLNCIEGVICDPDDPDPARRFKALRGAIDRELLVSPDCIHWTKLDVPKIQSHDECTLTYDRERKQFLAMVKGFNKYGRAFNIATSTDFETWTPARPLFSVDEEDQPLARETIRKRLADPGLQNPLFVAPDPNTGWTPPEGEVHHATWRAEVYFIAVFPYEGLYIGLPSIFYPTGTVLPERNNADGFHLIQLAMSRDLNTWKRLGDRQPFIDSSRIDKGRVGVFGRGQLFAANQPIERGDELLFYYSALKWRSDFYALNADGTPRDPESLSADEKADLTEGRGGVCLAVLRRDGFISLDAGDTPGHLITKPLTLPEGQLFLNLDAPKGSARIQVLDAEGQPIPGFTTTVSGDAVRTPVVWPKGKALSDLAGQSVQLKIELTQARLYAFWVE